MRRALVVAVAVLLAACGGPTISSSVDPAPPEPGGEAPPDALAGVPGRPPTPSEARAIARLLDLAERTRSLRFREPVPFRIQGRETITQFVRDQMEADEIERARVFYVALGLLAPDLDIHELLIRVLGEQIVGYYDPERSLMVVREDVAAQLGRGRSTRELGEAEMVIVHELVHALQDQRLGLGARYREERTIDGDNAFVSLVEGDATLAMIGHLASTHGQSISSITRNPALLRMLIRDNPQSVAGEEIESAPPIVRVPLISRYLDGLVFCATLHGDRSWPGVDGAHRQPPVSTEQVLHPERYVAGEQPETVTLDALPELLAAGLTVHDEDTLGELETSIYFGLGGPDERDESAAAGWGGDRLRIYRRPDGGAAVVWFTTWDDEGEAREAEAAALRVADAAPSEERGGHRVVRRGRAVLVIRALDPSLHAPVLTSFEAFGTTLDAPMREG